MNPPKKGSPRLLWHGYLLKSEQVKTMSFVLISTANIGTNGRMQLNASLPTWRLARMFLASFRTCWRTCKPRILSRKSLYTYISWIMQRHNLSWSFSRWTHSSRCAFRYWLGLCSGTHCLAPAGLRWFKSACSGTSHSNNGLSTSREDHWLPLRSIAKMSTGRQSLRSKNCCFMCCQALRSQTRTCYWQWVRGAVAGNGVR